MEKIKMEINVAEESKPKRVRRNPTRKWSVPEEKQLIEFLMENREIEKPTAQSYYRRFCLEKNVNIDWPQVRAKVRNLRVNYNKAKHWEGSTGVGNMEGSTIKSTLVKMCRYFDELEDIFCSRIIQGSLIEESLDSGCDIFNSTETLFDETTVSETSTPQNLPSTTASETSTQENCPSTSRKGIYSRTSVSDIMLMQTEMLEIKKRKLEYEKDLKEREVAVMEKTMALKEKELQLKESEANNQRELKIMDIETQKQLKLAELEMKERVTMEELRLKYSK